MQKLTLLNKVLISIIGFLGAALIIIINLPDAQPFKGNNIPCESMEGSKIHFHINLQLYKEGKAISLAKNIGIKDSCLYWLHTHEEEGIIHIESPIIRSFTLGEFFDIWGINPFDESQSVFTLKNLNVRIKKPGEGKFSEYLGRWSEIELSEHMIIAIGTGLFEGDNFEFPKGL